MTIRWTVDPNGLVNTNCPVAEQITAEGTTTRQCQADYSDGSSFTSPIVSIKIDKTAPAGVSGALARAADSDGWYNHPVAAAFSGQDTVVRDRACCSGDVFGRRQRVRVADRHLHRHGRQHERRRERRAQVRRDRADRDALRRAAAGHEEGLVPQAGHVQLRRHRRDLRYRGLHRADPVRRAGSSPQAAVAGIVPRRVPATPPRRSSAFQYDATAPALVKTEAKIDKGVARIGWERAGDVVEVELVRSPGINGAKSTIVYRATALPSSTRP